MPFGLNDIQAVTFKLKCFIGCLDMLLKQLWNVEGERITVKYTQTSGQAAIFGRGSSARLITHTCAKHTNTFQQPSSKNASSAVCVLC